MKPKAIFLSGSAGSGKSYIIKKLNLKEFKIINIDTEYESLLINNNLELNTLLFDKNDLELAGKIQYQARQNTNNKFNDYKEKLLNIIIDGTGAYINPIKSKKTELENMGYDTFMVMVYTSPITSLERNISRNRVLLPQIVLRTWRDVYNNIDQYKQIFGNNFVIIDNDITSPIPFTSQNLEKYTKEIKSYNKPKTPEEISKDKIKNIQLLKDIKNILNNNINKIPLEKAKQIIYNFI